MRNKSDFILMLSLGIGCMACTSELLDERAVPFEESTIKEITVALTSVQQDAETRTVFDLTNMTTVWASNDTIGIFPDQGGQVEFPVTEGGSNYAQFNGGGWGLKNGNTYSAYFPYSKWNIFRDNKTILMDYTGQAQTGNGNYDHLGNYDYLASGAKSPTNNYLNFSLVRLGSIVMIQAVLPEADAIEQLTLTSDGAQFVTKAYLDISGESPSVSVQETSSSITLNLNDTKVTSGNLTLTAYMMLYPVDFKGSGSNMNVVLKGSGSRGYKASLAPKTMVASKAYRLAADGMEQFYMLTNANLIAEAERQSGMTFQKNDDGTVSLDNEVNQQIVDAVTELRLNDLEDPTVCDEIGLFCNLEYLECMNNGLTTLDVSKNTKLRCLNCSNNKLKALDVSNNTLLDGLYCNDNQIENLDVSNNKELVSLNTGQNSISNIDLSNNPELENVFAGGNNLSTLDVTNNVKLNFLWLGFNPLVSIDLTNNIDLTFLNIGTDKLTSLDLSKNVNLEDLQINHNQLTDLEISNNLKLKGLIVSSNLLVSLDISKHTLLSLENVYVGNQVDSSGNMREFTLYVNGTQYGETLNVEGNGYCRNENVTIVLKDDSGANNPGIGGGFE